LQPLWWWAIRKGRVGFGKGKAKEVPEAIRKATEQAKRQMIRVPLRDGRTLHHDIEGRHGAGKVIMRQAVPGTGIIAGGPMRAVFEMLGLQDVVAKSQGSQNPYNMVRATFDALRASSAPVRWRSVVARRLRISCASPKPKPLTHKRSREQWQKPSS
jgi:small subunit ribosomal protein S5